MLEFVSSPYLEKYTDQEQLRILYALGWYNTYLNRYENIGINVEGDLSAPHEYLNRGNIDSIDFKWVNKRSLPISLKTWKTALEKNKALLKYILQFAISFGTKDNVVMLISPAIAKIAINNNTTYEKLKLQENRDNGLTLIELGTIGGIKTYIDLNNTENTILYYRTDHELSNSIPDNKHIVTLSVTL